MQSRHRRSQSDAPNIKFKIKNNILNFSAINTTTNNSTTISPLSTDHNNSFQSKSSAQLPKLKRVKKREDSSEFEFTFYKKSKVGSNWDGIDLDGNLKNAIKRSQYSKYQPSTQILIQNIRNRNILEKSRQIKPDIAVKVVKDYLIPMFGQELINQTTNKRQNQFGQGQSNIINELLLSKRLEDELQALRIKYQKVLNRKSELKQQVYASQDEIKSLRLQVANLQSHLHTSYINTQIMEQEMQQKQLFIRFVSHQASQLVRVVAQIGSQRDELGKRLHEESIRYDKIKNENAHLLSSNHLLIMENEIIGERLNGLYKSTNSLFDRKYLELQLTEELFQYKNVIAYLFNDEANKNLQHTSTLYERDSLSRQLYELVDYKNDLKNQNSKLMHLIKEKFDVYKKEIEKTITERDFYKVEHQKLEKEYMQITEEFARLRKKVHQFRQSSQLEEKICKLCQKVYIEVDNFNWSCSIHVGEFNGDFWWCCGKQSKDARGCITNKHQSKDDEEVDNQAFEERIKALSYNIFCSSCKETGHQPHNCPKDPNLRSNFDPEDEVLRIQNLNRARRLINKDALDVANRMMMILDGKGMYDAYCDEESEFSEIDIYARKQFLDIDEYRGKVQKQPNRYVFEDVITKEDEEQFRRQSDVRRRSRFDTWFDLQR